LKLPDLFMLMLAVRLTVIICGTITIALINHGWNEQLSLVLAPDVCHKKFSSSCSLSYIYL